VEPLMLDAFFGNIALMIILTGALVGCASTLVGTFLVLRGNSMLSDAISHSIIFGIVTVWLVTSETTGPVQILGAALTGVLTVFLTELLFSTRRVKYDAAIGLVFPALFAIGVLLLNIYAHDVHIDQHTVLLGEIGFVWLDTLSIGGVNVPEALVFMSLVTLVNLLFVTLFYKELKITTFDPGLAAALGFVPGIMFYALLFLVSATGVAAFDAVGAVLFIAFVIVPPSAAYLLTDRLWLMLVYGALVSIASSVLGYFIAIALDVSIGGMMAVMTGVFLVLAFLFGPRYGIIARAYRRQTERQENELRTVAVHLYSHEDTAERAEENVAMALRTHLGWKEEAARRVIANGISGDLFVRQGNMLTLTPKGRATARSILEPWRTEGLGMP
jgi:manganese/zinc/iron transport system permease protein